MKNHNAKLKILIAVSFVLIFVALLVFGYLEWQIYRPFLASKNDDTRTGKFTIAEGESVKEIAHNLERDGLIRDAWYFEVYVWQKKKEKDFQAGDFAISRAINIPGVARVLTGTPEPQEMEITIIEGWSRAEIDAYLARLGLANEGEFLTATANFEASIFGGHYDAPSGASVEGFLFPDTYRIYKDVRMNDILEKMLSNFQNKINPLLPEMEKQNKNLYEVLTLASIVEKESAGTEEMPRIAGIFYNRLNLNRALESDATVNFATGKKLRQPVYEDLQIDSLYNTYRYKGLPPGPICNPSLAAISAATHPEDNDYLYFLHPENGGTVFAKNLEEHKRNREQYLK